MLFTHLFTTAIAAFSLAGSALTAPTADLPDIDARGLGGVVGLAARGLQARAGTTPNLASRSILFPRGSFDSNRCFCWGPGFPRLQDWDIDALINAVHARIPDRGIHIPAKTWYYSLYFPGVSSAQVRFSNPQTYAVVINRSTLVQALWDLRGLRHVVWKGQHLGVNNCWMLKRPITCDGPQVSFYFSSDGGKQHGFNPVPWA